MRYLANRKITSLVFSSSKARTARRNGKLTSRLIVSQNTEDEADPLVF
jgi:hypothetical protein